VPLPNRPAAGQPAQQAPLSEQEWLGPPSPLASGAALAQLVPWEVRELAPGPAALARLALWAVQVLASVLAEQASGAGAAQSSDRREAPAE